MNSGNNKKCNPLFVSTSKLKKKKRYPLSYDVKRKEGKKRKEKGNKINPSNDY